MNSEEKVHVVQDNGRERPARKGHCKRFWWVYLVIVLIILVILLPIIFLVIIPKVAQNKLDDAVIEIDAVTVLQTRPGEYQLGIDSVIHSDGKIKATIREFSGDLYLEDLEPHTPFATLVFPETVTEALVHVNVNQTLNITNMDAFTTFNKWLLNNETLRVTIHGETHIHVHGISREYPITYRKTGTMKGLNDFKGTKVTNPVVAAGVDALGDNFHGTVEIPNPSVYTIELGNATFNNYLNGKAVGTTAMDNLTLRPGLNVVPMRAAVDPGSALGAVTTQPYCGTGIVPYILNGKNVIKNGERLSYFADALASTNQTIEIDVGSAIRALGLPAGCPP